ncbi:semaphorin-4B [Mantella aurantiaca]
METWGWIFVIGHTLTTLLPALSMDEVVPRLTLYYGSPERTIKRFGAEGVSHYTTLLLSEDGNTLYVGAREALFSLNSTNFMSHSMLTWEAEDLKKKECTFKGKDAQKDCQNYIKILLQLNGTHLYTCGTYAFSPNCTYIKISDFTLERDSSGKMITEDGKGRCPFDPEYKSSAIMVDGDMYGGTVNNFQGNEPSIYKSQDSKITLKTENSLNWLQDPAFVGSAHIQESKGNPEGDDEKIYFFFTETGKELNFFENPFVSRIARVCKGDLGGERVLQRKWTTFLKAQLLCTHPEDNFPFNVLQDMFVLTPGEDHWANTIFYGVFTSQWNSGGVGSSAVCAFSMRDVQKAFSGLYKEVNRESQQWSTYTHSVPEPRPGACITNKARSMKINSSLQMPDRVLNFIKDHFLMDSAVRSQPLLLQTQIRYQQISVQRVKGLKKTYDVMFLGTDDGRLHKAVSVNKNVYIIEEIQLFPETDSVQELLLDHSKGLVYASSRSMVIQVPVSNCSMYATCGECVLSRDPYCAWSKKGCRSVHHHVHESNSQHWLQDIENADSNLCQQMNSTGPGGRIIKVDDECKKIMLQPNNATTLPCNLLSNLATRQWLHNGKVIDSFYYVLESGDLILVNSPERLGTYECWSVEYGFRKRMAMYCVESDGVVKASTPKPHTEVTFKKVSAIDKLVNSSKFVSISESHTAKLLGKSYWNEFLIMTILFVVVLVSLALFILYKNRSGMKSFLKPVKHEKQVKKIRSNGKQAESLPLNGTSAPLPQADHKGYQTLNDNYIINTPVHDPLVASKIESESEKRPLNVKDTVVEVTAVSPRPRVRLGSEIRDSVV